jgi:hypothetical protein
MFVRQEHNQKTKNCRVITTNFFKTVITNYFHHVAFQMARHLKLCVVFL